MQSLNCLLIACVAFSLPVALIAMITYSFATATAIHHLSTGAAHQWCGLMADSERYPRMCSTLNDVRRLELSQAAIWELANSYRRPESSQTKQTSGTVSLPAHHNTEALQRQIRSPSRDRPPNPDLAQGRSGTNLLKLH
jgi:hypothetical protein